MRARDYLRNYLESSEVSPKGIRIESLPPTMDKKVYSQEKKRLLEFGHIITPEKSRPETESTVN